MAARLENKTALGQLILKNLYLMGQNQAWLAEQMGVNKSYITILCTKIKSPKYSTLSKLSIILGIDITVLYQALSESNS